jgi:hypothetical protein
MFPSHDNVLKNSIGKKIEDSYGREFGIFLGSTVDPYSPDKEEIIWIQKSNGELVKCRISQIQVEDSSFILTTSWIERSHQTNEALSTILRKISALNILKNNNEISQDAYLKLQKQYKRKLKHLTQSHQHLLDDAGSRSNVLESQIEDIHFFIANIKIEESVKKVPSNTLSAASSLINTLLSQAMREKKDLDQVLNQPEAKQISSNPSPRRELPPIQPIVLRIKEATL